MITLVARVRLPLFPTILIVGGISVAGYMYFKNKNKEKQNV